MTTIPYSADNDEANSLRSAELLL